MRRTLSLMLLMLPAACSLMVNAALPLRVGLGVSDQVYMHPTAQSGYEQ